MMTSCEKRTRRERFDMFAAAALTGLLADNSDGADRPEPLSRAELVELAWRYAGTMMDWAEANEPEAEEFVNLEQIQPVQKPVRARKR